MTTTELIALLQANEKGGATGRSREISVYINGRVYIPDANVTVCGTGDGLITDIDLDIKGTEHGCGWIETTDRLPPYGEIVLVYNDDGRIHTAVRKEGSIYLYEWQIMLSPYDDDVWEPDKHGKITHWKPIPAPPYT